MTAPSVRTLFMGSDPIALPFLQQLKDLVPGVDPVAVYTQPDRPRGRGQKLQANAIKQWAAEAGLPVRQPERCNAEDEAWLREQRIDLVLVMAYGQILKSGFLEQPRLGIYNLHTSLLPKYRGASPIHTALAEGETTTGVTLMRIIPEMDAGPIIAQEPVTIDGQMEAPELVSALAQACIPLLARGLPPVLEGTSEERAQDSRAATYCRRIFKEDAQLDCRAPAVVLHRRIRAFQPWPGAILNVGGMALKIGSAEVVESTSGPPGRIERSRPGEILLHCGEGALRLTRLQRPGGRMLEAEAFLRGFNLRDGDPVETCTMAPLTGYRPFPWRWRPGDATAGITEKIELQ